MTILWSTCFTRAETHFKAANNHLLAGEVKEGVWELVKAQQWLAESVRYLPEAKQ